MKAMMIVTGRVVDGRIVVEGEPFSEVERVTILGHEGAESFRVSPHWDEIKPELFATK